MIVHLFDQQYDTKFASLEMDVLPRRDDIIEIGIPDEQEIKYLTIWRVVHKMVPDQSKPILSWRWEYHLFGYLHSEAPKDTKTPT